MAGHLNGVATRLLEEEPRALFVHCLAHALNLCLQDCGSHCNIVRDVLHLTSEISNMIHASPKRLSSFTLLKDELAPGSYSPSLRPLCPTRWIVRNGAIKAVIANYSIIIQELDIIANEKHNETGSKAAGLIILMEKFSSYFGLELSYLVFSITEQLSSTFQNSHLNAQEAIAAAKTTQSYLKSLRSDKEFNEFYLSTVKEAKDITDEPILPRQRRLPQRYDDGSINYNYTSPQEYYRRLYYEVFDLLVNELSRCFDQKTFDILEEFERLLLDSCNGTTVQPSSSFKKMYQSDISMDRLSLQLPMLPDLVKTANEKHNMGIRRVTSINTLCEVFEKCSFAKTMLSEVSKLLRIYLTVPLSSATAERTFSRLQTLKNYLRSTTTQRRFNHLMLLHSHKDRTTSIDLVKIAKEFIAKNSRRNDFLVHFNF